MYESLWSNTNDNGTPSPGSRSDHNSVSYGSLQKGSVLSDAFSVDQPCHDLSASEWPNICNLHVRESQCCIPSTLDQSNIKYYAPFGKQSHGESHKIGEESERGLEDDGFFGPDALFFPDKSIWQRNGMEVGVSRITDQSHPLLELPVGSEKHGCTFHGSKENMHNKKKLSRLDRFCTDLGWNGSGDYGGNYSRQDPNLWLLRDQLKKDLEKFARAYREHQARLKVDSFGQVPLSGPVSSSAFPLPKSTPSPASRPINLPTASDKAFISQPKPSVDYVNVSQGVNLPFFHTLPLVAADEIARLPPHLQQQYVQYLKAVLDRDYVRGTSDKYSSMPPTEFWPVMSPNGVPPGFGVDGSIPQVNPYAIGGGKVPIFLRPGEIPCECIPPLLQFPQFVPGMKTFRYVMSFLVFVLK